MEVKAKNGWTKLLTNFIWATVAGFGGLCILGFFSLDSKIVELTSQAAIRSERIARLEECVSNMGRSLLIIESDVKQILKLVK